MEGGEREEEIEGAEECVSAPSTKPSTTAVHHSFSFQFHFKGPRQEIIKRESETFFKQYNCTIHIQCFYRHSDRTKNIHKKRIKNDFTRH